MTDKQTMWLTLIIITFFTMIYFSPKRDIGVVTPQEEYFRCMRNQYTNHIKNGEQICDPIKSLIK